MVGDGNDVDLVRSLALNAVSNARSGQGPQFLELSTFRWREHCGPNFDHELNYLSTEDIATGLAKCPIERYKKILSSDDVDINEIVSAIEVKLNIQIESAFIFSDNSIAPSPATAMKKLYA